MENFNEEFKTTLMGGFDKEDVLAKFKALYEESYAKRSKMALEIEKQMKIIEEKDKIIEEKNQEIEALKKDINEKYQSYIDNYDTIGKIVFETRVQSENKLKEAKEEAEKIIKEANEKAQQSNDKAELEVERKLADGKRKYNVLQEEINELIQLVNQVQHKFMQSFKAIHEISGAINEEGYESEIDECFDEEDE